MLNALSKVMLLVSLLVCSQMADAVEVTRLNEAEVPVASRASTELDKAIKDALAKVFVKNSGSQEVLNSASVKSMIANAKSILSQFGYVENNGALYVRASFDINKIVSTLRSEQLPVWGKQRPLTLVWLATDGEGGEKVLLGDQSELPIRLQFTDASNQSGVPLLFPLLDLDDMMQANVNSVRGFFPAELAGVSARYQSDFFALVTLDAAATGFDYRLALYPRATDIAATSQPQAVNEVSGNAPDVNSAIAAILSGMSRFYVAQYAVTTTGPSINTELVFTGVNKLKAVADIEAYLGQVSMIKSARLVHIQGDSVRFDVSLFGSEEELRRILALEPRLSPASGVASAPTSLPISAAGTNEVSGSSGDTSAQEASVDPFASAINPGDVATTPAAPAVDNRYQWRGQ